jgi:hypothetical protein
MCANNLKHKTMLHASDPEQRLKIASQMSERAQCADSPLTLKDFPLKNFL